MTSSSLPEMTKKALRGFGLMPLVTALNNARCALMKKWAVFRNKNPLEAVYNDHFFDLVRHEQVLKDTPEILAAVVQDFFHPASVVDFGCGCAIYLRALEHRGIEVFGIDGSPAAVRHFAIDKSKFFLQDLTVPFHLPKRYDCAICFEVAEHIPTETSRTLVQNITDASDFVVFTGAHKGQGGHDHINEQESQFWIDLFAEKGYALKKDETEQIKNILSDRGAIFWLANGIQVFEKRVSPV